jgi:hypothetical protein
MFKRVDTSQFAWRPPGQDLAPTANATNRPGATSGACSCGSVGSEAATATPGISVIAAAPTPRGGAELVNLRPSTRTATTNPAGSRFHTVLVWPHWTPKTALRQPKARPTLSPDYAAPGLSSTRPLDTFCVDIEVTPARPAIPSTPEMPPSCQCVPEGDARFRSVPVPVCTDRDTLVDCPPNEPYFDPVRGKLVRCGLSRDQQFCCPPRHELFLVQVAEVPIGTRVVPDSSYYQIASLCWPAGLDPTERDIRRMFGIPNTRTDPGPPLEAYDIYVRFARAYDSWTDRWTPATPGRRATDPVTQRVCGYNLASEPPRLPPGLGPGPWPPSRF